MPKVTGLNIKFQTGSSNTYFAEWQFDETHRSTTSSTTQTTGDVAVGKWVTIKPGATYYNGVSIPSFVMSDTWQVIEIRGDRAVINKNKSGSRAIMSPINVNNLVGEGSSSTTTTTTVEYNTLDHYEIEWFYFTGDGVWFSNGTSNTTNRNSTYSVPSNARQIKITVKPVSKTRKVNDVDTAYWNGTSETATYNMDNALPEVPPVPNVEIEQYQLTATIDNITDPRTDKVHFQVYNGTSLLKSGMVPVETCRAVYKCSISAGGDYRVRCRGVNLVGSSQSYSDWSNFTSSMSSIPSAVSAIINCKAMTETSIYLSWYTVNMADSYDIEYATKKSYFDSSGETTTISDVKFSHYEVTGLETGKEYFFRVRAVNEKGHSQWSEKKSTVIGKTPSAPTTWSSTTTCITGEQVKLFWVHNCEDGSNQTLAELEVVIGGNTQTYNIQSNETPDDESNKAHNYTLSTYQYAEGTEILWRVRTAGITRVYGDWSVQRTVSVYAPPTLEFDITDVDGNSLDTLTSFPFYVSALPGPRTQAPIGYHLTIISNETYESTDNVGNPIIINTGETLYSKYFDIMEKLVVEFSPNNVNLDNNISYTVSCTVSMNSGLTAEASLDFTVAWTDIQYEPDAEIGIDQNTFAAYIRPYCVDQNGDPITNVMLSVYRREFDGGFTELSKNIDATDNVAVTDPHPALDFARYRIVATDKDTGAVSFYDPPGYPVGVKSAIIQWNEEWSDFEAAGDDILAYTPWSGSLLNLKYNIDVSDNHGIDVDLVEYIGRAHPVSYYGTQLGQTATWSMEIPKNDKETLYAIRRLSIWTGDVYVREPSGSGYWANVSVSYSQKHCVLTIPISLTITRVEGGI